MSLETGIDSISGTHMSVTGILAIINVWLAREKADLKKEIASEIELREKSLNELRSVQNKQWDRIEDINRNYVTRDYHEHAIKDLGIQLSKASSELRFELTDSVNRLGEKVDRLIERLK